MGIRDIVPIIGALDGKIAEKYGKIVRTFVFGSRQSLDFLRAILFLLWWECANFLQRFQQIPNPVLRHDGRDVAVAAQQKDVTDVVDVGALGQHATVVAHDFDTVRVAD